MKVFTVMKRGSEYNAAVCLQKTFLLLQSKTKIKLYRRCKKINNTEIKASGSASSKRERASSWDYIIS